MCKVDDLPSLLSANTGNMAEYSGYLGKLIANVCKNGVIEALTSAGFFLFLKEATPLTLQTCGDFVNPRELMVNAAKALTAANIARGDSSFSGSDYKAREWASGRYLNLVLMDGSIYVAYDWRELEIKDSDAQLVVKWVTDGRKMAEIVSPPPAKKTGWGA
jgi:hypothetical protein